MLCSNECDGKMIINDEQILKEMAVAYLKAPIPEFIWKD
jgi:hypothetical protein